MYLNLVTEIFQIYRRFFNSGIDLIQIFRSFCGKLNFEAERGIVISLVQFIEKRFEIDVAFSKCREIPCIARLPYP